MVFQFIQWTISSVAASIYCNTQTSPNLASGLPLRKLLCPLTHPHRALNPLPCFLAHPVTSPAQVLESAVSPRSLVLFSREWYLEAKILVPAVFTAVGVSLLLPIGSTLQQPLVAEMALKFRLTRRTEIHSLK